jgi:hypothetical protein
MRTALCYSQVSESFAAGVAAARAVLADLAPASPDFFFLFTTVGHDLGALLSGISSVCPKVPLCGCSGSGVITSAGCDEATHSLGLLAISSPRLRFSPFVFSGLAADPETVGAQIAQGLAAELAIPCRNRLLFLFTDGLTVNADALLRGLEQRLAQHLDIVGGSAGNDFEGQTTFQFCNGRVLSDGVVGVLVSGDFSYCLGVSHGSRPVGLFRTITKAEKNLVLEIDGQPAIDFLSAILGGERVHDVGQVLNLFELGEQFSGRGYDEDIINRAIVGVDRERGAIRLPVELAPGTKVRITRRDPQLVLEKTEQMAQRLVAAMGEGDDGAAYFYFNCSGRGSYLFGEPEPDVQALRRGLGHERSLIGFFTFGEFAPLADRNYFHNYTGILVGMA